ncbi:hypothetical protein LCGC14_1617870 [marine sediment metagenome]|uniref:Uncharacterized protein n=1 Tax=marine sediment metagenome TaxID=412755 RepID=A0A0F9KLX5_9ZZZZ
MRLFVLAMTLFLLNVSIIMVDTLGIYNVNIANQGTSSEWFDEVQNAKSKEFDPDIREKYITVKLNNIKEPSPAIKEPTSNLESK